MFQDTNSNSLEKKKYIIYRIKICKSFDILEILFQKVTMWIIKKHAGKIFLLWKLFIKIWSEAGSHKIIFVFFTRYIYMIFARRIVAS